MAKKMISGSKKILVIEYYLVNKAKELKLIAKELNITYGVFTKYVREYENEKLLILPSRINKYH